jgi:hypothetical protein
MNRVHGCLRKLVRITHIPLVCTPSLFAVYRKESHSPRKRPRQYTSASSGGEPFHRLSVLTFRFFSDTKFQEIVCGLEVQYPLSEREPVCTLGVTDVLDWHQWADKQARAVGSSLAVADGGPTAEELQV